MAKEVVKANGYYELTLAMMISLAKVAWGEGQYFIYKTQKAIDPKGDSISIRKVVRIDEDKLTDLQLSDRYHHTDYHVTNRNIGDTVGEITHFSDVFKREYEKPDLDEGVIDWMTGKDGGYTCSDPKEVIMRHDPRLTQAVKNCPENLRGDLTVAEIPGNQYVIYEAETGIDILEYPEQERKWVTIKDEENQ